MKRSILILGILLIAGSLLIGPASAATVIGQGSKTVNYGYGDYNKYKWTTYKYSIYSVKMVVTCNEFANYRYLGTDTYVCDIVNAGSNRVKVVQSFKYFDSPTVYKYWSYHYVSGGNAVTYYNTESFKYNYLKKYLT